MESKAAQDLAAVLTGDQAKVKVKAPGEFKAPRPKPKPRPRARPFFSPKRGPFQTGTTWKIPQNRQVFSCPITVTYFKTKKTSNERPFTFKVNKHYKSP